MDCETLITPRYIVVKPKEVEPLSKAVTASYSLAENLAASLGGIVSTIHFINRRRLERGLPLLVTQRINDRTETITN